MSRKSVVAGNACLIAAHDSLELGEHLALQPAIKAYDLDPRVLVR
jgi:hypothetical protein